MQGLYYTEWLSLANCEVCLLSHCLYYNIVSFTGIRKMERKILEKGGYVQSVNLALTPIVSIVAVVMTFILHTLLKQELTASVV